MYGDSLCTSVRGVKTVVPAESPESSGKAGGLTGRSVNVPACCWTPFSWLTCRIGSRAELESKDQSGRDISFCECDPSLFGRHERCDGKSLAPGDACEWTASFKPTQTGKAVGKLTRHPRRVSLRAPPISLAGQPSAHSESTSAKLSAKILVEASHSRCAARRIALTIAVEVGRPLRFRITSAALWPKGHTRNGPESNGLRTS
jgi:hypothetical protein